MIYVIGVAALALAAYWLSGMRMMARMNKDKVAPAHLVVEGGDGNEQYKHMVRSTKTNLESQRSNPDHSDRAHAAPDTASKPSDRSHPPSAARRAFDLRQMTLSYTRPTASARFWQSKNKRLPELVSSSLSSISQRPR